jgi:hypothetical protein
LRTRREAGRKWWRALKEDERKAEKVQMVCKSKVTKNRESKVVVTSEKRR